MAYETTYRDHALTREEVEQTTGAVLLEFGANWCGVCGGFAPQLEALMRDYPQVRHIKVEDGKGKPLGRSFRVKLWPTLVFLRDGEVVGQVSRPSREEAKEGLDAITQNAT